MDAVGYALAQAIPATVTDPPIPWTLTGVNRIPQGAISLLNDGRVLFSGGASSFDSTSPLTNVDVYDYATNTLTAKTPLLYGRLRAGQTTLQDGRVVMTGGYPATGGDARWLEIYDPATNAWSSGAPIPASSGAYQNPGLCTLSDGRVLLVGYQYVHIYDPSTNTWTQKANSPVSWSTSNDARTHLEPQSGNKVIIFGGNTRNTYEYDATLDTWTALQLHPITLTWPGGAQLPAPDNRIVSLGSGGAYTAASVVSYAYDRAANTWTKIEDFFESAAKIRAITLPNGRIYVPDRLLPNGTSQNNSAIGRPTARVYTPGRATLLAYLASKD